MKTICQGCLRYRKTEYVETRKAWLCKPTCRMTVARTTLTALVIVVGLGGALLSLL